MNSYLLMSNLYKLYIQKNRFSFEPLRLRGLGSILLDLEQKTWILNFDKIIDIFESGFHKSNLGLNTVVSESNRLSYDFFAACHKVCREKLNEFVFDVLNEV